MIMDIFTIVWKEFQELIIQRSGLRGGWMGMLVLIAVFGVLFPLQSGPEWLSAPTTVLLWAWVPFILVNSVVADSFAGERERHTLETLLASRLSDRAILVGKLCAAIAYGWGITLIGLIVALVTINIAFGVGEFLFFPPLFGVAILLLSFLIAWLAAGLGVIVSLRAASVRQAQQTLSLAFIFLFVPLLLLPLLPDQYRVMVTNAISGLDIQLAGIILVAILLAVDVGLLLAAMRRFVRTQLILSQI
jgi:ABC-2 type transport system permease protein